MFDIRYHVTADGKEPFADWFVELEAAASAKIARAIVRMERAISPTRKV